MEIEAKRDVRVSIIGMKMLDLKTLHRLSLSEEKYQIPP
jgi:hypothetical protein